MFKDYGKCGYYPQENYDAPAKMEIYRIVKINGGYIMLYCYVNDGKLIHRTFSNIHEAIKKAIELKNNGHITAVELDKLFLDQKIEF